MGIGRSCPHGAPEQQRPRSLNRLNKLMNSIIYIVGLIVVVLVILSFFGLR